MAAVELHLEQRLISEMANGRIKVCCSENYVSFVCFGKQCYENQ